MESDITGASFKKEESAIFHKLLYSKEQNASHDFQNNEDLILKQEFVFFKKEEEKDDKVIYSNVSYYPEEPELEKSTESFTEFEHDSVDISYNDIKSIKQEAIFTEDVKEEHIENLLKGEKYLAHEATKPDIVEHKVNCSADFNDLSHTSANENHIQLVTSHDNDRDFVSGDRERGASLLEDKHHEKHEFDYSVLCNMQNVPFNYECLYCSKKFPSSSKLKSHVKTVHKKIKNYGCNECHKVFPRSDYLKRHIEGAHKGFKNYECTQCRKRFSQARYLKIHIDHVHKRIKNYECNQCGKRFSQKGSLKTHMNIMYTGVNKSFECNLCQKMYSSAQNLQKHINAVHKGIKNYDKCNQCHKLLSSVQSLEMHTNAVHKGIKTYECSNCHKMFAWAVGLKRHRCKKGSVHKGFKNESNKN